MLLWCILFILELISVGFVAALRSFHASYNICLSFRSFSLPLVSVCVCGASTMTRTRKTWDNFQFIYTIFFSFFLLFLVASSHEYLLCYNRTVYDGSSFIHTHTHTHSQMNEQLVATKTRKKCIRRKINDCWQFTQTKREKRNKQLENKCERKLRTKESESKKGVSPTHTHIHTHRCKPIGEIFRTQKSRNKRKYVMSTAQAEPETIDKLCTLNMIW